MFVTMLLDSDENSWTVFNEHGTREEANAERDALRDSGVGAYSVMSFKVKAGESAVECAATATLRRQAAVSDRLNDGS